VAARRLIFVMLALLVVSTFAATFASQQQSSTRTSTEEESASRSDSAGEPLAAPRAVRVNAAAEVPQRVEVPSGRRISLDVISDEADLVSIERLGLTEDVAARSPAHFDLRITERGSYPVRLVNADRVLATIEVGAAADGDERPVAGTDEQER
jgi:hypothetical protein